MLLGRLLTFILLCFTEEFTAADADADADAAAAGIKDDLDRNILENGNLSQLNFGQTVNFLSLHRDVTQIG